MNPSNIQILKENKNQDTISKVFEIFSPPRKGRSQILMMFNYKQASPPSSTLTYRSSMNFLT
ncbi:hypothetical protein PGT21_022520 [Puccinia graminis f. sp. tritici]|nr:hypothetical protein PGT21_022520 [Puccinia graminis f. sp. tritici]